MDDQLPVTAWSNCCPAIEINRGWQHEAVVIVGMLANQVHAPRRPVNARGRAKAHLEFVQKLQWCFQCTALSQICIAFSLGISGQKQTRPGSRTVSDWHVY